MKNQFAEFNKHIEGQFRYGGQKYAATGTKEATDILFDDYGYRWLIGTIDKYTKRFANLERERDLLKIAAYMYITWLKRGFHTSTFGTVNPINTTVDVKAKYFADFILTTYNYYETNRHYLETLLTEDALAKISNVLKSFSQTSWHEVSEEKLAHVYCLSFVIWNYKYFETGNAGKDTDTFNEEKRTKDVLIKSLTEFFKDTEFGEIDLEVLANHQVNALLRKKE